MGKFKKGQNFIKYEWISEATGATKNQIDHFLRWAKEAQMLATQKATRGMVVNVLKYETYQDLGHYKSDTKSEIKATQERHYTKECSNNDKNEDTREQSSQIQEIFFLFGRINPTIKYGNITQRKSCETMFKKFGFDVVRRMALFAIEAQGKPFSPTIVNPYQLETKWAELKMFYKKEQNKNEPKNY